MKNLLYIFLVVASSAFAKEAPRFLQTASHPIIGYWKFILPDGKCSEVYNFRPDGTTQVTSGEEIAESRYEVAAKPTPNGFYKLVDTITKDNGRKDCSGSIMEVGHKATTYIWFNPSGAVMVMCESESESLEACFGPLKRLRD